MSTGITIALAGNPNSGKSTLFNRLTGKHQHVANYPGVTVEITEGNRRHRDRDIRIVDLPGTYSLTAYSPEETAARDFLIDHPPDVVVHVVDSSNIERNLYLAVQLMELGLPLVLALNKSDMAKAAGLEFDLDALSRLLGVPLVPTVGSKGEGIEELLDSVLATADGAGVTVGSMGPMVDYGREVEEEIGKLEEILKGHPNPAGISPRWSAVKLLENDPQVREVFNTPRIRDAIEKGAARIRKIFGDNPEVIIAERRYGFISGACQEAVRSTVEARHTISDTVDLVLTNRALGIPIFLAMMYLVFHATFALGEPLMNGIDQGFSHLASFLTSLWPRGSDSLILSLMVDGIIGGVGGVIVFLPNIVLLFLAIALLEDSGYMARAAFILDGLMHRIGLHGKSFIPMVIGFGCTIPAVMATRTLESRRDRLTTLMVVPLMSCGARLTIYALIIPAFFPPRMQGPVLWLIYIIGMVLAIVLAKLLRATIFRGPSTPFVMEVPPYRMPTVKGMLIHMWERAWLYLRKAGTIILAISVVLWVLSAFPRLSEYERDYEAEAAAADLLLVEQAGSLNHLVDLPDDSDLLRSAVRAGLEMKRTQARYHPHEGGYESAEARFEAALDSLQNLPGGKRLTAFLSAVNLVGNTRDELVGFLGDSGIGSRGDAMKLLSLQSGLDALRFEAPRTFEAAVRFLDEMRGPHQDLMDELAASMGAEELAYSAAGRIGRFMEPALRPMGFDWKIGTALLGSFAAKEVFVAQLSIVHSVGSEDTEDKEMLRERLRATYPPLAALSILLFTLIGTPCMATVAVTKQESGSWKWPMLQFFGLTLLAFLISAAVYQAGSLLGIGL